MLKEVKEEDNPFRFVRNPAVRTGDGWMVLTPGTGFIYPNTFFRRYTQLGLIDIERQGSRNG